MPAVTIINIKMMLRGPVGPSQDLTEIIDDSHTVTDKTWSSDKIESEIADASSVNNSIVFAIALG